MTEKPEQSRGAWRGCGRGKDNPDKMCWLVPPASAKQPALLACLHPSTCRAAGLERRFLHVVLRGQTAVLSRGVSCLLSVSPFTSCSLIFIQNCYLEDVFFWKQLLFNLTELGWSSSEEMKARGSFPVDKEGSFCKMLGHSRLLCVRGTAVLTVLIPYRG